MPKTKRVKAEDGFDERKDLMQGMKALISLKVDKASSDSTMTKMTMLNKPTLPSLPIRKRLRTYGLTSGT